MDLQPVLVAFRDDQRQRIERFGLVGEAARPCTNSVLKRCRLASATTLRTAFGELRLLQTTQSPRTSCEGRAVEAGVDAARASSRAAIKAGRAIGMM